MNTIISKQQKNGLHKASNYKHPVPVNRVYKTSDLTQFHALDGNRPVNVAHERRLTNSIEKNGMLVNPIIVNEKYQVIDGQHRLQAARNAGSSVYYIIVKGYDIEDVHTLNQNQKNWTAADYLDAYANQGIVSYMQLRDFKKEYREFSITSCVMLCQQTTTIRKQATYDKRRSNVSGGNNFSSGRWKMGSLKMAIEIADNLRLLGQYYKGYTRRGLIAAIITLYTHKNFDFDEFLRKVSLQPRKLVDLPSITAYKELIEEIYNYKRQDKVNLRYA